MACDIGKLMYYTKYSIIFERESFVNAKKVLNFIKSLTNERK